MGLSLPHLLIIVILLFLLFGANRFPSTMENLAKGLKSFKHGMKDEDEAKTAERSEKQPDIRTLPRQDEVRRDEVRRADGSRVADIDRSIRTIFKNPNYIYLRCCPGSRRDDDRE